MKNIIGSLLLLLFALNSNAQDTKAKAILDDLKKNYESYTSMEMDFTLEIKLPEEEGDLQYGNIKQMGDQYILKLDDQEIISDGKDIYIYLKSNNEIQINNIDESDGEMMSPKDMMRLYESEAFDYYLANEMKEDGKKIKQIEFKPLDRDSEYSKMRLTVYSRDNSMKRLKIFAKDGSRYTMNVKNIKANVKLDPSIFMFKESNYPGVHIEDLRLD